MSWVPVVDISDANAPGLIDEACERAGFITILGHGVADTVFGEAWNTARAFFDLPLTDRMRVAMPRPGYPYGYSPMAGETLTRSLGQTAAPDLKESFAIGPVDRPTHYPAVERGKGRLGASAHTDYGTLTILLADPVVGGLQLEGLDGVWHDVDAVPGSLVVNLGDAMARWTNDRWRSTMHRVQVPASRRQSIAFFHNANWDAVIECLPTCLPANEEPKYAPIAAGPHLMQKFQSTVNTY